MIAHGGGDPVKVEYSFGYFDEFLDFGMSRMMGQRPIARMVIVEGQQGFPLLEKQDARVCHRSRLGWILDEFQRTKV